ncbi:HpcH/HpaI aldolase/citrate lyase family protein [Rhizobium sp. SG2393]|uniref:HpcH/HpaI aldolase family protein n=1 Tax=Rhizobium sp. SG2393 TaxID=3276279 RepID=UPI00366D1A40
MPAPINPFKAALAERRFQLGLWVALATPYVTEVIGHCGYDWLLIDGEHGPNDIPLLSAQVGALAASSSHPIVRLPTGEAWLIKQILDAGAQTLLIPMVESAEEAAALVRATRYPPEGIRGVGASLGRATRFGQIGDYMTNANREICLIVQVESLKGVAALDAIAATDGIDGVFIGPSDLAADMGHLGKPDCPEVRAMIADAFQRIEKAGKPRGIMTSNLGEAERYRQMGADFMAIGTDVTLLTRALVEHRRRFLDGEVPAGAESGY